MNREGAIGPSRLREAVRPGWAAVVHNWKPFLLIQAATMAVAVLYYSLPAFQQWANGLQQVKVEGGVLFAALTSAFAGVVLPEIAVRLTLHKKTPIADLLFRAAFFCVIGSYVDLLYRVLAGVFGTGVDPATVLRKVLVDMFVSTPLVTIATSTLVFLWKENGFSFRSTGARLSEGAFLRRYIPLLVTCWALWIPALTAIYAMPSNLQFLLFLFTQAAWSLLLIHISKQD
jgi:hypothetical protein